MPPHPFIPMPNGATCEVVYRLEGRVCENLLWFLTTLPSFGGAELAQVNTIVGYTWFYHVMPLLSQRLEIVKLVARDVRTAGGITIYDTSFNGPGGSGFLTLPANCAVNVALSVPPDAGDFRGRLYIPGVDPIHMANNRWEPTWATALGEAISQVFVYQASFTWSWVLAHQWQGGWLSSAVPVLLTTAEVVNHIVAPRRKRLHNPAI